MTDRQYSSRSELSESEVLKEWFSQKDGPEFIYDCNKVVAVKKRVNATLFPIYEALSKIDSPHLQKILDINIIDSDFIEVITEYLPGRTLQQIIDENHESETCDQEVYRLAQHMCEALSIMHSLDPPVIHRDIKPENILLSDSGNYVLMDFDASRLFEEGATSDTVLLGSNGYAAPEQYGFFQSDERSDIYSLGATLFEYKTGKPFRGNAKRVDRFIGNRFAGIIDQSTQFDSSKRFNSVDKMMRKIKITYKLDLLENSKWFNLLVLLLFALLLIVFYYFLYAA